MIDLNVITVKITKQVQESLFLTKERTAIPTGDNTVFISSNDEKKDVIPVDSSDSDLVVISTKPIVSGNA